MPFRANSIYFAANKKIKKQLEKDPVLSYNLYWIKPGTLKDVKLPKEGLFVVRDVRSPEHMNDPYGIPWDAVWSKKSNGMEFYPKEKGDGRPPNRMLERIHELTVKCKTKAFFYSIEMHGGTIDFENTWIFGEEQITILDDRNRKMKMKRKAYINNKKATIKGDPLYHALKNIGVKKVAKTGWWGPHTGPFVWRTIRQSPPINRDIDTPPFPTSLFRSASLGDYDAVKRCLKAGISPVNSYRILLAAASSGNAKVVKLLLDNGATACNEWHDPLRCARNKATVKLLLDNGSDINNNSNPLAGIAEFGTEKAVKYMLKRGAKIVLGEYKELWINACKGGMLFLVKKLASQIDIDYNRIYGSGITVAAANGRLETVKWLAEAGATISQATLVEAAKYGHINVVKWLMSNSNLDIDGVDHYGNSALHKAAGFSQLEMVNTLLELGADQHRTEKDYEFSALHEACFGGRIPMVERLLDVGIDVNCAAKDGRTPLWIATSGQYQQLVDFLIERGASTAVEIEFGDTLQKLAKRNKISLGES